MSEQSEFWIEPVMAAQVFMQDQYGDVHEVCFVVAWDLVTESWLGTRVFRDYPDKSYGTAFASHHVEKIVQAIVRDEITRDPSRIIVDMTTFPVGQELSA